MRIAILGFIAAVLLVPYCNAQDGAPIKMSVSAEAKHYTVGDIVKFTVEWENLTDRDLKIVLIPEGFVYASDWFGIYDTKGIKMKSVPLEYIKPGIDESKSTIIMKPKQKHSKTLVGTIKEKLSYYDYKKEKTEYYGGMYVEFKYDSAILLGQYGQYILKAEAEFPYGKDKGCWTGHLTAKGTQVSFRKNIDKMKTVGRTHRKMH